MSNAPVAKAADHAPAAEHAPPVEEKHDKPKAKPHTDKRLLDHELNAVLKQFDHGKLDMQAAVARFVAFDQKHSGGEMSADGQVMLAMLVGMLMAHESEKLRKKYESEHHGPTTAPAEQGKPPVINDHEAPAKGPAPVFNPPANPKLEDQNLDALAAQLHDPKVTKVMADLASAVTVWRTAPRDSFHEIKGEPRENLVHGIAVVREGLKGLGGADEKTAAFKTAVFHKLEQIAPYHHQHNMRTIETGDYTTCNVTSLAMSLEAIGKTAESYKPGKREIIKKVAERCNSSVSKAASTLHGHGASWEAVAGLRFPDFMQLAAISHRLKTPEFSESDFKAAAMFAASNKTHADFLADIASDFSATGKEHYLSFGSEKADKALEKFSDDTQADAQVLIDARNAAEAHPESKVRQDAYAEAQQGRGKKVAGNAKIDRDLPLEHYKATVIGAIKPLMDAGHGVISGCYHHFTRCYEINDKYIMVQDPGQYHRTERKLMWDEARALRYFWNYIVIS
ncbi:MAG TPA: hypothetical protein VFV99_21985 [Kofleriaceae bacterium]|nr:hypothetical protein [Kofleriaceae bacterium]